MNEGEMPARIRNALRRNYLGKNVVNVPLSERPSDAELLVWARARSDAELRRIRNLGRCSIAWIRDHAGTLSIPETPSGEFTLAEAWHAGYEEGIRVGRALAAMSLIGPAIVEGILWRGGLNGSAASAARRSLHRQS